MARYTYCCSIVDDDCRVILPDIECTIVATVEIDDAAGDPRLDVIAVLLPTFSLGIKPAPFSNITRSHSRFLQLLAADIATKAENDPDLLARAIEAEGIVYTGRGANDPDGQFMRAA